jgi:hypothetical protein
LRTHALQVMLREDAGGVFIASLPASDAGDGRHTLREGEYVLRLNGLDVCSPSEPPVHDANPYPNPNPNPYPNPYPNP